MSDQLVIALCVLLQTEAETQASLGIIGCVALYALGLGLYFAEIFLPSGGIIFVGATLCVGYAIWQMFEIQPWAGGACLAVTAVYLFVLVRWGIRRLSMAGNLGQETSTGSDVLAAGELVGSQGETETALRPAGVARFAGVSYDVVSNGDFLEAGARVVVADVSGNRIVVRLASVEPDDSQVTP